MPENGVGRFAVSCRSDAAGAFDVRAPRGRPVRFRVEAQGYAPFPSMSGDKHYDTLVKIQRLSGKKPVHLDVELDGGTTLEGRVRNTADRSLSDVNLAIRFLDAPVVAFRGTTDADGCFRVPRLAAGNYLVDVLTPGLLPENGSARELGIAGDAETQAYTLTVRAAHRARGRVVTETGTGVAGARVWVVSELDVPLVVRGTNERVEAYTSSDGSFVLTNLPTDQEVMVRASMGSQEAAPARLEPPGGRTAPAKLRLVLTAAGDVQGKVVDLETGEPLAGVLVGVRPGDPSRGRVRHEARTARDGTYHVRGLLPGRWSLEARIEGYLGEDKTVDIGPASHQVPFELGPDAR